MTGFFLGVGLRYGLTGYAQGGGGAPADLTAMADENGGVWMPIAPSATFQERTGTSAATPAAVGDPVGTIKSADGSWFAVATTDAQRGILRQDLCGNYYVDGVAGTRGAYEVVDAAAAAIDLGQTKTVFVAFQTLSDDTIVGFGRDGTRQFLNVRSVNFFGNETRARNAANAYAPLFDGTDDPITVPHVVRLDVSASDIAAYYNDNPVRRAAAFTPLDETGVARALSIMMPRTGTGGRNPVITGGFYGIFAVPVDLTASEKTAVTTQLMARSVPGLPSYTVSTDPAILDFDAGAFEWGGSPRVIGDLTDNGGGSYTLDYNKWWTQGHVIVVDVEVDPAAGSWSGTFVTLNSSGNSANEEIIVNATDPDAQVLYAGAGRQLNAQGQAVNFPSFAISNRVRVAFIVGGDGEVMGVETPDGPIDATYPTFPALPPETITVNTTLTGWQLHRAAFYSGALSGTDLYAAMNAGEYLPVVHHGDSFVEWDGYDMAEQFAALMEADGNWVPFAATSGGGGKAFFEENGTGHQDRWEDYPQHYGKTLILNDGALEDRTEAQITGALDNILGRLTSGQYLYLQSNPINPVGDSRRPGWEGRDDLVETYFGANYVPTLEAVFCAYSDDNTTVAPDRSTDTAGSAYVSGMTLQEYDLECVALGVWPRTMRTDSTHYAAAGRLLYARAAYAACIDAGYLPGTTALPDAPTNLVGGSDTLTWDAPADDGGHPVLGYLVEFNNGGTWETVATQGSPTGYSKQYIRSMTGLAAGDYRVSAITAKGQGAAATATVATAFTPASLFTGTDEGVVYDVNPTNTGVAVDAAIATLSDTSGNANNATQATGSKQPILRQSGALYYAEFDGTNDSMGTASIDFTATDQMTVIAGVRKLADGNLGIIAEVSPNPGAGSGRWRLYEDNTKTTYGSGGSIVTGVASGNSAAPVTAVYTGISDISADQMLIRENGVQIATNTNDQGTGNYEANSLFIGGRNNSSLFFSGQIYGLIVINRALTAGELADAESWMAAKCGVTL